MTAPARTLTAADFVLARIAEDEAAALAATPGPWRRVSSEWGNGSKAAHVSEADYRFCLVVTHTTNDSALDTAAHIARHDPARVLAQCEALRAVVAIAEAQIRLGREARGWGNWEDMANQTLRALASIWRDHDEWQEAWG